MDIVWLDEMQLQLQLQWLRQPASLIQLLQRPAWLDAWVHGEEERASFLWRGLPNHVILHILKLRTIEEWTTKFDCVLKLRLKRRAINKWKWKTLLLSALRPARLAGLSRYEMFDAMFAAVRDVRRARASARVRVRDRTLWASA